jgi:peptide/nickel transport system permease protein
LKYISQRLVQGLVLFVLFLAAVYLLLDAQPGDISQQLIANPKLPPEAKQALREQFALDDPLLGRVIAYVTNFFQGNLGLSFSQYPRTVGSLILERLPRTVVLFLSSTLLAYYLGFAFGKVMAWRRGRRIETFLTLAGVGGYTVFYPWFAILMIWTFGFILNLFPIAKFVDVEEWSSTPVNAATGRPWTINEVFMRMLLTAIVATLVALLIVAVSRRLRSQDLGQRVRTLGTWAVALGLVAFWSFSVLRPWVVDILHHTLLPVITLASIQFAGVMLLTRSSMLETLREDYILTARAKGVPERDIRNRHAARNALLPVVTSLVLALAFVIGGGIITETVFSWPGLGLLLLSGVSLEDIPLATGTLGIIGILALLGHLVADLLYMFLDPRIRYS